MRIFPIITYSTEGQGGATPAETPAASTGDDVFEEEDIEIPGEEGAEPEKPAEESAQAEPPRTPKKRGPKRYAALTQERDQARSYAEQVAAELDRMRQRAEAAERKAAESQDVAMQTYEAKAKTDLLAAEKDYKEALASQDAEKITSATKALTTAQTAFDDVVAYKKQKPAEPEAKPQEQPRQQQQEQFQDLPPHIKSWAVDNRWWDMVARDDSGNPIVDRATGRVQQNPEFDADMHAEATLFAQKLERQIARGQVAYKTASPEYFKAVEEHMREEFPDYFGDEDAEDAPPARKPAKGSPVASPGGRNIPGAAPKAGGQSYKLSADEVRFITKSVQNGGGPKYPKGHPNQFKPMTLEDAKVSFARRKIAQSKENPAA